ncbi:MAG: FAD-dependent oxidoreductase [Gemmatimonadota bacterium]|nr:FAD-dependent oxidoreductase [Gemmatimonadota bacterium]
MSERANFSRDCDLVAIGGGTGGLVTAAGAAYLGLKPALVERSALGGDCLWTGCVPSKALIASARLARNIDHASTLGLQSDGARSDFRTVMERMRAARATVARHDDPERFRKMGVSVHFGAARFLDASTVEVEGVGRLRSRRFVIATGAVPAIPPIPGLKEAGYWTYETVFDQNELPGSVVILGGGPIGLEFAQVFARLGSRVTVLEMAPTILIREDPDVAAFMHRLLTAEGMEIRVGTAATAVRTEGNAAVVETSDGTSVTADRVFVATGRRPMTDGLNLEAGAIRTDGGAVVVDSRLQTSSGSAWAVGDVTGALQFTHVAEQMAKVALRNAVIPGSTKIRYDSVPWVTYTDPEIAHVGMSEAEAEAEGGTTYRYELDDLDRAIVDASAVGFVKVSADRRGRVLGATIVAHGGGELILPLVMARQHGLTLGRIANTIFPYPTMVEGVKRAAGEYMRSRLDTPSGRLLKRIIQWLK